MTFDPTFRPMVRGDLPRLAGWLATEHVARWWIEPSDEDSVAAAYGPDLDGAAGSGLYILMVDGRPAGLFQCYRLTEEPEWAAAVGDHSGAGIDYLIGEVDLVGRGLAGPAIAAFSELVFDRYPEVPALVAAPQQANVASWRALERAGFRRTWAGQLDSDDPGDAGPAYLYRLDRPAR
jgi:aminoglycoside 6'-N-acetyltransferase